MQGAFFFVQAISPFLDGEPLGHRLQAESEISTLGANFTRKGTTGEKPIELIVFVSPAAYVCTGPRQPFLKPSLVPVGGALWEWGLTASAYSPPSPRSGT